MKDHNVYIDMTTQTKHKSRRTTMVPVTTFWG
jgi:hypothetical protein